jgi:hypothetical protein
MIRALTGWCCAAIAGVLFLVPGAANADYFSATISLTSLPSTITLCRDGASAINGFDEQWLVLIDVDDNPATGVGGADAALLISTNGVTPDCTPQTVSTQDNIVAALFQANATGDAFDQTDIPVAMAFDFIHSTLTATTRITGPISGLWLGSVISVVSGGGYLANAGNVPSYADDDMTSFLFQSSATDAQNDVQQCSAPCGPSATWYGLIDLIGASTTRLDWIYRDGFEQ